MPLQIDATLIYARGDPRNRTLSDKDKLIDSPYNTYTHTGPAADADRGGERGVAARPRSRPRARRTSTTS